MTKEQFIQEAHKLALEFSKLCWEFNASESKNYSAEVYGNKFSNGTDKGTIIVGNICFSMQQNKSNALTDSLEPATLDFSIGQFDSAKMVRGTNYFDNNGSATDLQVTEYAYGKLVLEDDVATVDIDFLEQEPDYPDDGMTPEEVAKYIKYFGLTGIPGKLDSQGSRTYTVSGLRSNIDKMLADMDKSTSLDYKFPWDTDDVNGDGDTDITVVDTDDDGSPDTAITTADSKAEDKEATEVLKEKFEHDDEDITTTGKTKKELENETLSDERQKDKQQPKDTQQPKKKKGQLIYDDEQDSGVSGWLKKMSPARNKKSGGTVSDVTQKNILKVLSEHRF